MEANLSLYALSRWMIANNHDLFSKLVLPAGINKETLIDNILIKSAEMSCVYQEPFFTENAIGVWSNKWNRTLTKWVNALSIDYNPLENYDRIETYTDTNTSTGTANSSASSTDNTKNNKAAYDSDTYKPVDDIISTGTSSTESEAHNTMTAQHTARLHGNIGVTTSQQMLQSELNIARFNLIEQITDIFIQEFCILVY